jgi:spoIIIJ-associated protein
MGEKAQRGKRPVTISQLTATERRVVHLALQEIPGLKTRSRGDGPLKNIVIIPGGKKGGPRSAEPNPEPEHGSDPEPEPDPVAPGEPPEAWDEAE